jgi:hypothetical protein
VCPNTFWTMVNAPRRLERGKTEVDVTYHRGTGSCCLAVDGPAWSMDLLSCQMAASPSGNHLAEESRLAGAYAPFVVQHLYWDRTHRG